MKTILLGLLVSTLLMPMARADDPWTVMIYMDGDDKKEASSLEMYAIYDFEDMAETGSGDGINVVVQLDRHAGDPMTDYGDWSDTRRFFVTAGVEPTGGTSIGEANMGDPYVLSAFIDWAQASYPAQHYLLVLWYPGQSWKSSSGKGDSTSSDVLTITEIAQALTGKNIDVVAFDTNGMAMIENAYELRDCADYMAACEGYIRTDGLTYKQLIAALRADPSQTAREAAVTVVDTYYYYYLEDEFFTAIDLSKMDQLASSLDNLSDQLISSWNTNSELVKTAAADLLESYDDSIVRASYGSYMPLATGMSIYFPDCFDSVDSSYTAANLSLLADTDWDSFLGSFHSSMCPSWVADVRNQCQVSDELDSDADLGHLSRLLYSRKQPYTVVSQVNNFQGGGTAQGWTDSDKSWEYSLPFSFPYYGEIYNSVWIYSNGFLDFKKDDYYPEWKNTDFGVVSNCRIAPLWSALWANDTAPTGEDIYITENPDHVIIRWKVETFDTEKPVDMEIALYQDGMVAFNYGTGNLELEHYLTGRGATVGISKGDGSLFSFSSLNGQTDLNWAPTQIFEPVPSPSPSPSPTSTPEGYKTPTPSPVPTAQTLPIEEGFDLFDQGQRPEGWSFLYCNYDSDVYLDAGNYGTLAPSLKLSIDNARITSREFSGHGEMSFWLKGNLTDSSSSLLVEQYDSPSWVAITEISRGPTLGQTLGPFLLNSTTSRVRFTFQRSSGEMAFDDVYITNASSASITTSVSASTTTVATTSTTVTTATEGGATVGDFDGDGTTNLAVWRASSALWKIRGVSNIYFGTSSDQPVPQDYDGDGTWDVAYFRPSNGLWKIRNITRIYFGNSSDLQIPGDYDGDSTAEPAYFRPSSTLWNARGFTRIYFGTSSDHPIPADYDGDGSIEPTFFRGSNGLWKVRNFTSVYFGSASDTLVPGDYNGDGTVDFAWFRPSNNLWKVKDLTRLYYGTSTDTILNGDFNGNGTSDFGYFRANSTLWKIKDITRVYFGQSNDVPISNQQ